MRHPGRCQSARGQPDGGEPHSPGNLILFPAHSERPLSTSITFNAGALRSNNAIAVLGGGGQLGVYTGMASGSTHLIIDVFGYFE